MYNAMTTCEHDGTDYAPHLTAYCTSVNGRVVPVTTAHDFVSYLRDVEAYDRNTTVSADDVEVTSEGLTMRLPDYDDLETFPIVGEEDGHTLYAILGSLEWVDYNGPCDGLDCDQIEEG